jgi:DNA-directed RNA polymerase specialized sigma24 family protein
LPRETEHKPHRQGPDTTTLSSHVDREDRFRTRSTLQRATNRLDPEEHFERYRQPAIRAFRARARANGYHAYYDLDEAAQELYNEFWTEWMERSHTELHGAPVPYIATAMINKLRTRGTRGRSIRGNQMIHGDSERILAIIPTQDPDPLDQMLQREELWCLVEFVQGLLPRERVAFTAVRARDSKKKGAPLAGYKLAAAILGVSTVRAKKLSLAANKKLRVAIEQIESGSLCERWARSICLVAAGAQAEPGFRRHTERCIQCRHALARARHDAQSAALVSI